MLVLPDAEFVVALVIELCTDPRLVIEVEEAAELLELTEAELLVVLARVATFAPVLAVEATAVRLLIAELTVEVVEAARVETLAVVVAIVVARVEAARVVLPAFPAAAKAVASKVVVAKVLPGGGKGSCLTKRIRFKKERSQQNETEKNNTKSRSDRISFRRYLFCTEIPRQNYTDGLYPYSLVYREK